MYRGRPPPRGGYPPYEGRGPRLPFREERDRPRPPFQPYHDGPPDPYRRSPPRRRYPSPGSGGHRGPGGEYWGSGPTRPRSPSPCSGIPVDHSLVITVGNEFTGLPSRDYPPYPPKRSSYDSPDDRGPRRRSPSRGRSRPRSPEYRRRSISRPRSRSPAVGGRSKSRVRSRSPGIRGRSKSRVRSRSPRIRGRSKSRVRSRSPGIRGRSKSRVRSRSPEIRGRSKSRVRSRSPGIRGRSKSRVRSRSPEIRGRSKSRVRSRSPERRGRSKSRARSPEVGKRSRSRPPSRSRSRSQGRGRSYTHKSRSRSVSTSSTSSSSSSSVGGGAKTKEGGLKELELARRRKEMEDMLIMPTKSILKRRVDSDTDSQSYMQDSDSPRVLPACEAEAERLLSAMKGMDPNMLATMLGELRDDPHMAQGRLDSSGIAGILGLLGGASAQQDDRKKKIPDIDDEEKFLYGDEDDLDRGKAPAEASLQTSLSGLYSDIIGEPAHYGATSHLGGQSVNVEQTSSHQQQVDMRYQPQSRSSATPDLNIKAEELNDYPPGTGPLVGKEKQDVEEYEKIQDLLKTIGLDLGVTEISKMAARTQERLHGKRPALKTPTHCPGKRRGRRDSSGSSDRGRRKSHSSRSSSSGSSRSHSRSRSGSQDKIRNQKSPPSDRHSDHGKARGGRELKPEDNSWGKTVSPALEPSPMPPPHPSLSMPAYPHAQGHGLVPQNYPPPNYGQYGNWPYMPHQWPMYPPPSMGMPPQSSVEDFPNAQVFDRPFLKVIQPELNQGDDRKASLKTVSQDNAKDKRTLEERNNESQKQKVLEEREKLRQDREIRMKKKDYLMKELERLRKQQGELLRKKRREKDGHKDPLLSEISRLQEEVMSQIGELRKEHEVAEKKRSELDTVALILGLQPNDKPRQEGRASVDLEQPKHPQAPEKEKKQDRRTKSPVAQASAKIKSSSRASPEKPKKESPASSKPPESPPDPFEYYDAGNHWCKSCNVTCGSMFDFFTHLHSKTHRKTLDPYSRPWASTSANDAKNKILSSTEKLTKPAKGSEFLVPVKGYYCQLCEEFCGDAICAEDHCISHTHNDNYKKRMYEHPLYEQRRNLDRQAGLTLEVSDKKQSELKRKHDEEVTKKSKEKEEGKHKRSKKEKEEDRKAKHKEAEEKAKQKEADEKARLIREEEEEERYKLKKDEMERRYKYSKEGGERSKYSKKEEEEYHKYRREDEEKLRYRRDEEDRSRSSRVDERPKSSWRDNDDKDEERSRYGKWNEPSPKYNKKEERYRIEHEEGKFKNEKEKKQLRKEKSGLQKEDKSESRKQIEPEKSIEPPKVFCGPNPALRAKLRKKNLETGKVEPKPQTAFGKFSWKKKLENQLAKEAERVAAEFMKEDEAEPEEDEDPDAFSKSVAAARSFAFRLSGKTVNSPTNALAPLNVGKIRPNLPAPSMVLRKVSGLGPWVYAKPAPLNTFLSIRPPGPSGVTPVSPNDSKNDPVLAPDIISKAFCGKEVDLIKIPFDTGNQDPTSTQEKVADSIVKPVPTPASDEKKASTIVSVSEAPTLSPKAVIPEFKTPLPPPPVPTMMAMKSDVSAPGVPENEQNVLVMVTPPPFMQRPPAEVINKLEKPKSSLATAKAQDLFDIFYSSSTTASTTSTICTTTATKAIQESKPKQNISKNSDLMVSAAPQTQPKLTANDNSNTVEINTQESTVTDSGSDLPPVIPIETVNKSEQTKSSKAAEKAQDVLGVVYSSSTTVSSTSNICTSRSTEAILDSKSEQNVFKDSKAMEDTLQRIQPPLTADDNSNEVETDTHNSMETESVPNLQQVVPSKMRNKSEKPKSSLAAGNSQDLFNLLYGSTTASTTCTMATKAVLVSKFEPNDTKNSEALKSTDQTQHSISAHENSNMVITNTQDSREAEHGLDLQPKVDVPKNATMQLDNQLSSVNNCNTIEADIQQSTETEGESDQQPKEESPENVPVQLDNQLSSVDNSNTIETDTQESKTEIQSDKLYEEETPKSIAVELDIQLSPLDKHNIEPDTEEFETEIGSDPEPKEETLEDILENSPVQLDNHLLAVDNSDVETHTSEPMETESRSDTQPKEETLEESSEGGPLQLENPSDTLGISTETLDLPTEVLSLNLFDFNFE